MNHDLLVLFFLVYLTRIHHTCTISFHGHNVVFKVVNNNISYQHLSTIELASITQATEYTSEGLDDAGYTRVGVNRILNT